MEKYDISWLKKFPIAHRGLHDISVKIPENSLKAFANAVKHNYAIELDVYVISDQQVIVFHDDNLKRMCGIEKNVNTLNSFDYHLYNLLRTEEKIPLLQEVLHLVDGKVPIIIEIKNQPKTKNANMVILNILLGYKGFIAIQSFNPFIMGWFAKNAPTLPRGQLSSNFKDEQIGLVKKFILKKFIFNFVSKPHFIAYNVKDIPNRLIVKKRKKGILIIGWTVNSEKEYQQIAAYCDNIIFESFKPVAGI